MDVSHVIVIASTPVKDECQMMTSVPQSSEVGVQMCMPADKVNGCTQQHDSCSASLAIPALAHVWALGLFTHSGQLELPQALLKVLIPLPLWRPLSQPGWLA